MGEKPLSGYANPEAHSTFASMSEWKTHEEYTAKYGTQEAQAAVQSRAKLVVDGPWLLAREIAGRLQALDNSVRSTSREIWWLHEQELTRTGVNWTVLLFSDFESKMAKTS